MALPFKLSEFFKIKKFYSFSQIERTTLNSLEKSAGMKKAELGDYIVALKISIITDILQKAQENISAVNVENILTTLLELSLKPSFLY